MVLFDKNVLKYANQLTHEQMMTILQTIKYHLSILAAQSEKYRLEYQEKMLKKQSGVTKKRERRLYKNHTK